MSTILKMVYIHASSSSLKKAVLHLLSHDVILAEVITLYGNCTLKPHTQYYQELVESIISQQLSVKAAASITKRFVELFGGTFPLPEVILAKSIEELRTAGLSQAKASYIQDLAWHVSNDKLNFARFQTLSNEEIISELTAVKGIGEWTAQMFLIFSMGRLDVLPVGDLGIKNGIMRLYNLKKLPTPAEVSEIAASNSWHPYESVASWYIWKSLDNS